MNLMGIERYKKSVNGTKPELWKPFVARKASRYKICNRNSNNKISVEKFSKPFVQIRPFLFLSHWTLLNMLLEGHVKIFCSNFRFKLLKYTLRFTQITVFSYGRSSNYFSIFPNRSEARDSKFLVILRISWKFGNHDAQKLGFFCHELWKHGFSVCSEIGLP